MKVLNIYDLLEERHIVEGYGGYTLSGHTYRNSPFETADSCGNCDGQIVITVKRFQTIQ